MVVAGHAAAFSEFVVGEFFRDELARRVARIVGGEAGVVRERPTGIKVPRATLPAGAQVAVQIEVNYLREHGERMDYRAARRRGEPLGRGAVEATCRQYQCRCKRPASLGAAPATRPSSGWKRLGATAAGLGSFLTLLPLTLQASAMHPVQRSATAAVRRPATIAAFHASEQRPRGRRGIGRRAAV